MKNQLTNALLNLTAKVFFGKDNFNFLDVGQIKIEMTKEDKKVIETEAQNFGSHADIYVTDPRSLQVSTNAV